jgi:hypothetical protein
MTEKLHQRQISEDKILCRLVDAANCIPDRASRA